MHEKSCFRYVLLRFSYLFLFFKSSASGNYIELIFSWYSSSGPAEKWWTNKYHLEEFPEILQDVKPTKQRTHMHDVNCNDHQEDSNRNSKANKFKFIS